MTRHIICLILLAVGGSLRAQQEASPEMKLREALRNTTLQLRDAQNSLAVLEAEKAENEQKVADMTDQLEKATQENTEALSAAEENAGKLTTQNERLEAQLEEFRLALVKWKRAYNEVAEVARTKEAERATAASQSILLQRRVDDATAKNREMYKVGREILNRYEKFNLGDALLAKEPFVGTTRVKIQNLMQDYRDDLADQRVEPVQPK